MHSADQATDIPPKPQPVVKLSSTAATISGVTYRLESNFLEFEHLKLECLEESTCNLTLGRNGVVTTAEVGLHGRYRLSNTGTSGAMPGDNRLAIRGEWARRANLRDGLS